MMRCSIPGRSEDRSRSRSGAGKVSSGSIRSVPPMNKPITLLVTLAMGIGALTGMAAPSRSVGQLLDVTGPVEIERARQKPVKVCMLFPLRIDDRLRVGAGGTAQLVLFRSGAR